MAQVRGYFAFSNANLCSMKSLANPVEPPFAADAGIVLPVDSDEDPYRRLDDLMAVVKALCPVWPARGCFVAGGRMLL